MRISTKLLSVCAVLAFSACSESSNVGPDLEPGMAVVPVMVSAAPGLSTLVVEITANDITTPLAYNLTMVDGTASRDQVRPRPSPEPRPCPARSQVRRWKTLSRR